MSAPRGADENGAGDDPGLFAGGRRFSDTVLPFMMGGSEDFYGSDASSPLDGATSTEHGSEKVSKEGKRGGKGNTSSNAAPGGLTISVSSRDGPEKPASPMHTGTKKSSKGSASEQFFQINNAGDALDHAFSPPRTPARGSKVLRGDTNVSRNSGNNLYLLGN